MWDLRGEQFPQSGDITWCLSARTIVPRTLIINEEPVSRLLPGDPAQQFFSISHTLRLESWEWDSADSIFSQTKIFTGIFNLGVTLGWTGKFLLGFVEDLQSQVTNSNLCGSLTFCNFRLLSLAILKLSCLWLMCLWLVWSPRLKQQAAI